jgi:predicted membrane-bound spermidine synthase
MLGGSSVGTWGLILASFAHDEAVRAARPVGVFRVERLVSRFGTIDIVERRSDGARLYLQDEQLQSFALPGGVSLFPYIQAMRSILLQAKVQRIAMLGAAGGTLATMMVQGGAQSVLVDINPDAFALAKKYFWLAPSVDCVVADARRFLTDGTDLFDAIVLDAHGSDDMPAHLTTVGFFSLARKRLLPQGLLVVNAPIDRRQRSRVASLSAAIAASGFPLTVFDDPRQACRNAVIVGGYLPDIELPRGDEPAETRRELASLRQLRPGARSAAAARASVLRRR